MNYLVVFKKSWSREQVKKTSRINSWAEPDSNKIAVFEGDDAMIGSLMDIRIFAAEGRTLFGEII